MLLKVSNLTKSYFKGKLEIPALREVSFEVSEGDFISIVGKSGSGKSTLLNLIGGLDTATAGHIYFRNKDLWDMNRTDLAQHRKYSIGMIFQSFNLISSRNAIENITLALTFGGVPRKDRKQIAIGLLSQVGLEHRVYHKPSELSGGEAQRVAIARAMANNPSLILADEPTGNLDSITSNEIIGLLQQLNKEHGINVIMVTHDQETAKRISKKVIRLHDGGIVKDME